MATGTSRRIYVEGAGTKSVSVTASSSAVRIRKDSKSYIVTANRAGTSNTTVSVGGTKKRFHIVVLSDRQIAERVWAKVKKNIR